MSDSAPNLKIIGFIPARWASTRFPGKPLHLIAGKTLVQHVWERCRACSQLDHLAIATDDARIASTAKSFGADVVMTRADHPSGSDRLAEAVEHFPGSSHVINIQGDEPLICPQLIDQLASELRANPRLEMTTAATPLKTDQDFQNSNIVKVVLDLKGYARYFSRSPIPHHHSGGKTTQRLRHLGIYGYRADFLKNYVTWSPSPLEQCEQLEQLRALENGARIKVVITNDSSIGVDTPEQARQVEQILLSRQAAETN